MKTEGNWSEYQCPESQGVGNRKRGWGRQMDAEMAGGVVNKDFSVLVMESQGEGGLMEREERGSRC